MKRFSQNNEQDIILDYFKKANYDHVITFLDLGANDGITLSNTHALALLGAKGHLVEPCETPFKKLSELYMWNPTIQVSNVAVGVKNGEAEIFSSDSHLKNGDTDLLSTLKASEIPRWRGTQTFTPVKCKVVDFKTLLASSELKQFDFISMDIEGMEREVLEQMNLKELGCKMLCIEFNGVDHIKKDILSYCSKFGMKLINENGENLILTV